MLTQTVITVGIDLRPPGAYPRPGRSANPGPFAVGFAQVGPRGVVLPGLGVFAYLPWGRDVGERERIKTPQ
jgi:hypothetical protein